MARHNDVPLFSPERRTIDSIHACPDAEGPLFAMVSHTGADGGIVRRAFSLLHQDVSPEQIASSLHSTESKRGPIARIDVIRAHSGTQHADPALEKLAVEEDRAYVNEPAASFLFPQSGMVPFAADLNTEIIDPTTAKRTTVGEMLGAVAMVVPVSAPNGNEVLYPQLDSSIVFPGQLPSFTD